MVGRQTGAASGTAILRDGKMRVAQLVAYSPLACASAYLTAAAVVAALWIGTALNASFDLPIPLLRDLLCVSTLEAALGEDAPFALKTSSQHR